MNILVLGPPSSGKSQLAQDLSSYLGMTYVDVKAQIILAATHLSSLAEKLRTGKDTSLTGITSYLKSLPKDNLIIDGIPGTVGGLTKLVKIMPIHVAVVVKQPYDTCLKNNRQFLGIPWVGNRHYRDDEYGPFLDRYYRWIKKSDDILSNIDIVLSAQLPNLKQILSGLRVVAN